MHNPTRNERLIEATRLSEQTGQENLRIVDVSAIKVRQQYHIPASVWLAYSDITAVQRPVMGLLPDAEQLQQVLAKAAIQPHHFVVAYDEEGGGKAARLLWTLKIIGHQHFALLNGGLQAWAAAGLPLQAGLEDHTPASHHYPIQFNPEPVAERDWIMAHLQDESVALLDARSKEEYLGQKAYATRAGRIPGAIHFDWLNAIDQNHHMRLMPESDMRQALTSLGITQDKTVVNYCQTHHRSSLTWFVLEWLGYTHNKGYPGSWSDWGNQTDTPVETGKR
ncbi:MAG: sulfurtransferase [gamma proteobacterium symbiont of Bathyaustriella thionipta]|nr:sulfurtransferase [gamma proteobacterium symbiont of Bathyaustriella thionipta]